MTQAKIDLHSRQIWWSARTGNYDSWREPGVSSAGATLELYGFAPGLLPTPIGPSLSASLPG